MPTLWHIYHRFEVLFLFDPGHSSAFFFCSSNLAFGYLGLLNLCLNFRISLLIPTVTNACTHTQKQTSGMYWTYRLIQGEFVHKWNHLSHKHFVALHFVFFCWFFKVLSIFLVVFFGFSIELYTLWDRYICYTFLDVLWFLMLLQIIAFIISWMLL